MKTDAIEILKDLKVLNQLQGWQYILNDMVLNNEIYDICAINMP